jgi:TrpR family trp operon transcriptional repressor
MTQEAWKGFLKLCSDFKSLQELEHFFDLFLTLDEKQKVMGRYLVIKALQEGTLTQREITERFHMSISQITRGSNALKIANTKLMKKLEKHFSKKI